MKERREHADSANLENCSDILHINTLLISKIGDTTTENIEKKLTRLKILSGLKHLRSIRAWAAEFGAMCLGIQQSHTKLGVNSIEILKIFLRF